MTETENNQLENATEPEPFIKEGPVKHGRNPEVSQITTRPPRPPAVKKSPETDYSELHDADLLHAMGTDGYKWAQAFCQKNPDANVDESTMLGWFCNAIMHTLDTERGTVMNGEHVQYLIDNNLTPQGNPSEDANAKAVQAIGYTWAWACTEVECGRDPRDTGFAEFLTRATKNLEL